MPNDLSVLENYLLNLGTQEVSHTNSDFYLHLRGVYSYLERWGCLEYVALAGLFHSLYGTEGFQGFTLPLDRRDEIRGLIGDRAERLVYTYCALTYESMRESVLSGGEPHLWDRFADRLLEVTAQEFTEILWMMMANTLEIEARLRDEEKSLRFASFWRKVAERLGGAAVKSWDQVYGSLVVQANDGKDGPE
jgi:hypothetical protein